MEQTTRSLIDDVMAVLGLVQLGRLELYPATDLRAPGWSFLQPITTSHISGHYFEKPGKHPHLHMDFYSCDSVEWRQIIEVIHKHVSLADWRGSFIVRGWGEDARAHLDLAGHGPALLAEIALEAPAHAETTQNVSSKLAVHA